MAPGQSIHWTKRLHLAFVKQKTKATNQYSSFWIGIDGYSSSTVDQMGTDSDCQNGKPTYYAWYEFYPSPSFIISSLTIHPGDIIFTEVKYTSGTSSFTISIQDVTTGRSFSTSKKISTAQRTSAEWIAEAPWSGGVLPLANFGTVNFGFDYTAVIFTCYATVNGATGPIAGFGSFIQRITMTTTSGEVKAEPSPISSEGSSFSVTWHSSGP